MMTATLLVAVILGVGGGYSLWRMRGQIPALEAARRLLRVARVERYVTKASTVVLVLSAVVIFLFLW